MKDTKSVLIAIFTILFAMFISGMLGYRFGQINLLNQAIEAGVATWEYSDGVGHNEIRWLRQ